MVFPTRIWGNHYLSSPDIFVFVYRAVSRVYKYKIVEEFAVKSFAEKPSLLMLDSLKKTDLLAIAQHYKLLPIASSQKKGEIKKLKST